MKNSLIIGCGGIGMAVANLLSAAPDNKVTLLTANKNLNSDDRFDVIAVNDHTESEIASSLATVTTQFDYIYCCLGLLHNESVKPEKSLNQWGWQACQEVFAANAFAPLCYLVHLQRLMAPTCRMVFLSARVGSIGDNGLGGWYSYRMSKAALNMAIKTASIELARSNPKLTLFAYHPGTTDSQLSKPFQANVKPEKLFTPSFSAECLVNLIEQVTPKDSGKFFAWDGQEIEW